MEMTAEEKQKRQSVVEQTKKVISEMNDLTDLKKRIQEDKKKNNSEVITNEEPLPKVANPNQVDTSL